jgi:SAM-dependent methyltransferase
VTAALWSSADAYEPYVGRWSRLVAAAFLDWLAAPGGLRWLDVGCGTGALTATICATMRPRSVRAIDPSAAYIAFLRKRPDASCALAEVGDAQTIHAADGAFDRVVSGLVLNFIPDAAAAAAEMRRVAAPGGEVAAYVWDYSGRMELMRVFWDAAAALDPRARDLDEGVRFPLCRPERLTALFSDASLRDVEAMAIDVPTVFRDFDDYWRPFLGGNGPAPAYAMSLDERARDRLRDRIRAELPVAADGTIRLVARAWAVRGAAA